MSPRPTYRAPSRVLGGCGECDAVQEMHEAAPGVYILKIYHDPSCSTYERINPKDSTREQA